MTAQESGSNDRLNCALTEIATLSGFLGQQLEKVKEMADCVSDALTAGNTIFFMGNGGLAAEAQHIAAEFVGRMRRERTALSALALTTDASILTAISNDWDFDQVYSRQIEALCSTGDVVVGLSGSGNSSNLVNGLKAALEKGAVTIACTGTPPNQMIEIADLAMAFPTKNTARTQEMHLLMWHAICEMVDDILIGNNS